MRSLFAKYFAVTAAMIFIGFILLGGTFMVRSRSYLIDKNLTDLENAADSAAELASAYSITGELKQNWNLRMSLSLASQVSGVDIIVCDETGEVLLCSDNSLICEHIGRQVKNSVANSVLKTGEFSGVGNLGGVFDDSRYVRGKLVFSKTGDILGMVFVSEEAEDMVSLFGELRQMFIIFAVVIFAASLAITVIMTQTQVKPLKDMAAAAKKFAHGDFSARAKKYDKDDEIGELNTAFNSMADSMEQAETLRRDFVANVSHELKTPMTTISGFVDGILDGTIPREKQQACLETVSSETKRLSKLVTKMLDISRLQSAASTAEFSTRFEVFDVAEMMRITLLGLEKKIENKALDVDFRLEKDEVKVFADKDSIQQVVYNLFDNAIKFSTAGSELILGLEIKNNKAEIFVSNAGETIPPEHIGSIFERFHKVDKSRSLDKEGMGLGLYIVKTILNAHEETITAKSENGRTEFRFTLKLSK